jgi:protein-S-isoprenylcysteine O-methyltransferase Ste14
MVPIMAMTKMKGELQERTGSPSGWITGIVAFATLTLLLFLPAGRLDWLEAWIWLGLTLTGALVVMAHVHRRNPGLAERRRRLGAGTPEWDRVMIMLLRLSFVAVLIVSGLDRGRYGWSSLGLGAPAAGAALVVVALLGIGWSMGANRHFETTVRIQEELEHRVIDQGPYRFVRHPGYLYLALLWEGSALMLGSAWALIPATVGVLVLVVRTALEDRFLLSRLEGYREYAGRVRSRLVPFVW